MKQCGRKHKILLASIIVLSLLLVVAVFGMLKNFGKVYCPDILVESPNGGYTLIIKEWGTLGGTGASIYIESASSWWPRVTRHKIGDTIADDCTYPFRDGNYRVSWESDRVVVRYYSGRPKEDPEDVNSWTKFVEYTFN